MGTSANVEDEGLLKPWNEEMGAFTNSLVQNTAKTVEQNSLLATIDGVKGGVEHGGADTQPEGRPRKVREEGDCLLAASHGSREWREYEGSTRGRRLGFLERSMSRV